MLYLHQSPLQIRSEALDIHLCMFLVTKLCTLKYYVNAKFLSSLF